MKRMVDDFRDYAKTPPAVLSLLDLNALIEEILHLYLNGDGGDIIHASLAQDMPFIPQDFREQFAYAHLVVNN